MVALTFNPSTWEEAEVGRWIIADFQASLGCILRLWREEETGIRKERRGEGRE